MGQPTTFVLLVISAIVQRPRLLLPHADMLRAVVLDGEENFQ